MSKVVSKFAALVWTKKVNEHSFRPMEETIVNQNPDQNIACAARNANEKSSKRSDTSSENLPGCRAQIEENRNPE